MLIVCAPTIAIDAGVFIAIPAERGGRTAVAATEAAMPAGVALSTPCTPPPLLPRYRQAAAAATAAALPMTVFLPMTPRCLPLVSSSHPQRRAVAARRWRRLPRSCYDHAALPPLPPRFHRHCHRRAITAAMLLPPPCCCAAHCQDFFRRLGMGDITSCCV